MLTSNTVSHRLHCIVCRLFFRPSSRLRTVHLLVRSYSDAEGPGEISESAVRSVAVASNDSAIEEKFSQGAPHIESKVLGLVVSRFQQFNKS
jgi:hypothetical protein